MADFDEDLLRALQVDGRAQFSTLAAGLGVHRSLVAQRVHELLGSGELRVLAAVHPRVLGFPVQAHLALRLAGPTGPVFERLRELDAVVYLSEVTGASQAVVEAWASSQGELARTVHAIRGIPGVVEVQLTLYDRVLRTLLLGEEPTTPEAALDDFDVALMTQLQRDGRLTFGELARRTGHSPSACRSRVLRLLEARVMRVGGVRRRGSGARGLLFGVGVSTAGEAARAGGGDVGGAACDSGGAAGGTGGARSGSGGARCGSDAAADGSGGATCGSDAQDDVERAILALPGLEFLARTIGRHSLVATVAVRDIAEYTEVVRGLRGLPGVAAAETWIHAAVWTERYDWSLERLVGRRGVRPGERGGP